MKKKWSKYINALLNWSGRNANQGYDGFLLTATNTTTVFMTRKRYKPNSKCSEGRCMHEATLSMGPLCSSTIKRTETSVARIPMALTLYYPWSPVSLKCAFMSSPGNRNLSTACSMDSKSLERTTMVVAAHSLLSGWRLSRTIWRRSAKESARNTHFLRKKKKCFSK